MWIYPSTSQRQQSCWTEESCRIGFQKIQRFGRPLEANNMSNVEDVDHKVSRSWDQRIVRGCCSETFIAGSRCYEDDTPPLWGTTVHLYAGPDSGFPLKQSPNTGWKVSPHGRKGNGPLSVLVIETCLNAWHAALGLKQSHVQSIVRELCGMRWACTANWQNIWKDAGTRRSWSWMARRSKGRCWKEGDMNRTHPFETGLHEGTPRSRCSGSKR